MAQLTGHPGAYATGNTAQIDETQKLPLMSRGIDRDGNEYIYLQGVALTVAGDWVTFDEAGITTRSAASAVGPVAVAQAAVLANQFGWYQIYGRCAVANTSAAVADNAKLFLTATAGAVDDTSVAGDQVVGAIARSAAGGAGSIVAQLNYPQVGVNVA